VWHAPDHCDGRTALCHHLAGGDPGHAACCRRRMRPISFAALLCLFVATAATAQTVYVVDNNGFETKGILETLGPATLTIRTAEGLRRFDLATQVTSVHRKGDSVKSGGVIGAVVLGTLAGLYALGDQSCGPLFNPRRCTLREGAVFVGGGAAIGAGIGVGIDALRRGRTRIYPSVARHAAGAVVSVAW
jgi:hypothetical protein